MPSLTQGAQQASGSFAQLPKTTEDDDSRITPENKPMVKSFPSVNVLHEKSLSLKLIVESGHPDSHNLSQETVANFR